MVIVTDTMHRHAETWLNLHIPQDAHAFAVDTTSAFGQLNIQGPKSRELMQAVTSTDMSNEAFPYRHAEEIAIGYAKAICVRLTYLGELGYERYIVEVGKEFNLTHKTRRLRVKSQ